MRQIEFTEDEIHKVWSRIFEADVPETLTIKQVFEACLSEMGGEYLREELKCLQAS